MLRKEASDLLSTGFRARNPYALGLIGFGIGHGREGVPLLSTRLPQHGLTIFARIKTKTSKWALETPCHTRIATGPQDSTEAQFSAVLRSLDLRTNWTTRPAPKKIHSYSCQCQQHNESIDKLAMQMAPKCYLSQYYNQMYFKKWG